MGILGVLDDIAAAAAKAANRKAAKAGQASKSRLAPGEYVRDRKRTAYPGIYKPADQLAAEAASRVPPESPNLKDLFGVTRDDLFEMSRTRRENPSVLGDMSVKRGSEAALNVMTPRNTERMINGLLAAQEHPDLYKGMAAWYNLDPIYWRAKEVTDAPEQAVKNFNTFTGMASPASDVLTELRRGTVANYLHNQGRMDDMVKYAVNPKGAPEDIAHMPGHPYGGTSHAIPMEYYSRTGESGLKSPKVPPYIQSAMPEELGGTWTVPVGDAHFSRAVGLADTRGKADYAVSVSHPELRTLTPWWTDVSAAADLQPVPGQAVTWGVFAPQTGVETAVGVPKLELFADEIARSAKRRGVNVYALRDDVIAGRKPLSALIAAAGLGTAAMQGEGAGNSNPSLQDETDAYLKGLLQ